MAFKTIGQIEKEKKAGTYKAPAASSSGYKTIGQLIREQEAQKKQDPIMSGAIPKLPMPQPVTLPKTPNPAPQTKAPVPLMQALGALVKKQADLAYGNNAAYVKSVGSNALAGATGTVDYTRNAIVKRAQEIEQTRQTYPDPFAEGLTLQERQDSLKAKIAAPQLTLSLAEKFNIDPTQESKATQRLRQSAAESADKFRLGNAFTKDAALSGGNMAANLGMAAATGAPYLAIMGVTQGAQAGQEALAKGASAGKSLAYGTLSGGITAGIESLGGVGGNTAMKALESAAKTKAGATVLAKLPAKAIGYMSRLSGSKMAQFLGGAASEGAEEFTEYGAQLFLRNIMLDEDTPFDIKQALYNAGVGAVFGAAFGGAKALTMPGKIQAPAATRADLADHFSTSPGIREAAPDVGTRPIPQLPRAAQPLTPRPLTPTANTTPQPLRPLQGNTGASAPTLPRADSLSAKVKTNASSVMNTPPVSILTGNEFPKSDRKLTEQVGEFFRSLGNKVNRQGFGDVVLNERGVQDSIAHGLGRQKAVTFAAVPDVIKNGKEIDYSPNWKGRRYDTHVFAAPVKIASDTRIVAAVVIKEPNTGRYYLHEVFDETGEVLYQQKNIDMSFKTGSVPKNQLPGDTSTFKFIIPDSTQKINSQSANTAPTPYGKNTPDAIINPQLRETTSRLKETGRNLYREMVSGQAPLERMAKEQAKITPSASTAEELVQQVRNAGGTVDYTLEKGLSDRTGNTIGASWKELVNMPEFQLRDLNEYMQHKHNVARQAQGKPVLEATAEQSVRRVAEMETANPVLKQKAQQIQQYWDKFMREWVVGGGLLSEEQYEAMRKMYPDYIPTYRVDQDFGKGSHIASGRKVGTAQTIKAAKGGVSEVKALEDNFANQMNKFIRAERKNELFLNLVDFARTNPEAAAPYAKLTQADKEAKEAFKKGFDGFIDDVDMKSLREVEKGVYRLTAYENGKPVSVDISEEIFKALDSLLNPKTGWGQQLGRKLTGVPKSLITGHNPFFAVTNIVRDVQTGYVNSITDRKTFVTYLSDLGKAASDMAQNTSDWKLFQANGGARSGFFQTDKGFKASVKSPQGVLPKGWDALKKGSAWLGEQSERVTRFAEFQNGLKKYGRTPEGIKKAINAAAEVTVNFSRSGPTMKAIDSWVIYSNAQVQGIDRMARQIQNKPLQTLRRAAEIIAIPAAVLYFINHDNPHYEDLDTGVKDNYFLIPNMADRDANGYAKTFIRFPKSREYGVVLGGLLERSAGVIDGQTPEEAFAGYGESLARSFLMSNPATNNALSPVMYNLPQNKNWAGSAIVPEAMKNLEPRYQYDYSTSEIGKRVGGLVNQSPKKVDYLIDQYTGIVGDIALPLTTGTGRTAAERGRQFYSLLHGNLLQTRFTQARR